MARTQPTFFPVEVLTSHRNRPDTAAGPSRIHTGVPCLPAENSSPRPVTRFAWRSLRVASTLSSSDGIAPRTVKVYRRESARGKPCRQGRPYA